MNKKFLSLVLALVMVLGTFGSVFAAEAPKADAKETKKVEKTTKVPEIKEANAKVQWLVDNEIVTGRKVNKDDKADLALDKNIQRAEITKLLVYAIGRQDLATKIHGQVKPYSDVANSHWANGYITVGTTMASPKNALPFLHGYVDGSFKPENDVTYVELAKMLVVLVKDDLTQKDFETAVWPRDWMAWAAQLGILEGVKVEDSAKAAPRHDAFVMLYNALYKLGGLRNIPANETMGIISAASANKITLNQGEAKKEFTVNLTTNFVPANYNRATDAPSVLWGSVVKGNETYYLGSLVRVLADDKGNVTHIVQLGNPTDLAIQGSGWKGIAQETVETANTQKAVFGNLDSITIGSTKVNTIDATRYFVADYAKRQLTEVKNKDAALALFNRDRAQAERVYVGYDVLPKSGIKEAKVVVFGEVDESAIASNLVRVVTPGNSVYTLSAQKPGETATEIKTYDLRDYKAAYPYNYGLEQYDVIKLASDQAEKVIDFDEDNIYKIDKVVPEKIDGLKKVNGRNVTITLSDGKGTSEVDLTADAKLFFADKIKAGEFVQVKFLDSNARALEVVSVVPAKSVRGELPAYIAKDNREVHGVITDVFTQDNNGYTAFSVNKTYDDGKKVSNYPETFVTTNTNIKDLKNKEVTFLADKAKYADYDYSRAYGFKVVDKTPVDTAEAAVATYENNPSVENYNKALEALKPVKGADYNTLSERLAKALTANEEKADKNLKAAKAEFEATKGLGTGEHVADLTKEQEVKKFADKVAKKHNVTAGEVKRIDASRYPVTFTDATTGKTITAQLTGDQVEKPAK